MTSHRLYLLRHAKSSWDEPELSDHDRPLAKRGRKATKLVREHLREERVSPDLVLCSSAVRAVQTLEGIRDALGEAQVAVESGLYRAGANALLNRLHDLPEEVGDVMLIGHNPAIEGLADELAGQGGDPDARERMATKYPTGGLATFGFSGRWSELDWEGAQLESFVVPRELG